MTEAAAYTWIEAPEPFGALLLVARGGGLAEVRWRDASVPDGAAPVGAGGDAVLAAAAAQLGEYFAGAREAFELPLAPEGTPFQRRLWARLADVPFGATTTYGALAEALGDPNLARAVGAANGANPLPIVVPCHRVVGSDGSLTGFAGGLDAKRWLLAHEGRAVQGQLAFPGTAS